YKLPSTGPWWYGGGDPTVDYKLTIGRFVANAGSTVLSLEDETARGDGTFPPAQQKFNQVANGYLQKIWPSLGNTYGRRSGPQARSVDQRRIRRDDGQQEQPGDAVHPRARQAVRQHLRLARQRVQGRWRDRPADPPGGHLEAGRRQPDHLRVHHVGQVRHGL